MAGSLPNPKRAVAGVNAMLNSPGISVPYATAEKINAVADCGFKLVRLQAPTIATEFDAVVNAVNERELQVVLDFCHPSRPERPEPARILRELEVALLWLPQFKHGIMEIVNEPRYAANPKLYDAVVQTSIERIREESDCPIVITNPHLGDVDFWSGPLLKWIPPQGENLIASTHYYRPFAITHPEIYFKPETKVKPLAPGEGTKFDRDDWANVTLHLTRFKKWCGTHGVGAWIGEAGCHMSVPNRVEWFTQVERVARKLEIPICWWAWNDIFGVKPGISNWREILRVMTRQGK